MEGDVLLAAELWDQPGVELMTRQPAGQPLDRYAILESTHLHGLGALLRRHREEEGAPPGGGGGDGGGSGSGSGSGEGASQTSGDAAEGAREGAAAAADVPGGDRDNND